jgi:haloalkane dehalogenase
MSTSRTIPGFPFESHYATIDGVNLHYVDEGAGPPILMFHGEPTWSYLYRKMIPPLVDAGFRCVAPDLMGFGMSEKPSSESEYTLRRHVELMAGLVESLKLEGVTIVGQDWGGPIGLRYAIDHQSNVRALVILNTLIDIKSLPMFFKALFASGGFSSFLSRRLDLLRKVAFSAGFKRPVAKEAMAMYKMPHPNASDRGGVAAFPKMVPGSERHENAGYVSEISQALKAWDIPVLVCFSDKDIAFKPDEGRAIAELVPNGRFHLIEGAGHFLQEDAGEEIAELMVPFLKDEAKLNVA